MATFVLGPHAKFPVGTTVGAYAHPGNVQLVQEDSHTAPLKAATTTAVVQTDGTTTFTGLADDTAYVAAAQVSAVWQRTNFRTPKTAGQLSALLPSWRTRRRALGLV